MWIWRFEEDRNLLTMSLVFLFTNRTSACIAWVKVLIEGFDIRMKLLTSVWFHWIIFKATWRSLATFFLHFFIHFSGFWWRWSLYVESLKNGKLSFSSIWTANWDIFFVLLLLSISLLYLSVYRLFLDSYVYLHISSSLLPLHFKYIKCNVSIHPTVYIPYQSKFYAQNLCSFEYLTHLKCIYYFNSIEWIASGANKFIGEHEMKPNKNKKEYNTFESIYIEVANEL